MFFGRILGGYIFLKLNPDNQGLEYTYIG